ncbi:GntR family transcriptional regulator [Saccharopolyspora phatthalungensis]|uniref:DNA-binding GntR family transcriptional regulator n=1 Tax=Saccharopolyspora phatthalungensis TaxID=664693 RepID=A0A840QDM7_9PSEU|nr:GntR family transcriptional regulator [Saccharopolyspora phatthalungensis]MBB5158884.1 DNA-binding GntR family transcriptional regulator [Saccharopolyspora phatthalungensis]
MKVSSAERIADAVYQHLREQIFSGELLPGARLSVPALAEELEVSRSPVRDAVLRLTQERLAREEPRRGAVVARVGAAELAALYDVREVLEGLAARLAVENAGRRLVDRLHEILAEHEEAVEAADLERHLEADMRFHALVRQAGGNPEVIRLLDDIQTQIRLAMRTTTVTAGPRHALADHRTILAAIESGDPAEAERAARAHISRLRLALLASAKEEQQ